jgi:hypothetical protein
LPATAEFVFHRQLGVDVLHQLLRRMDQQPPTVPCLPVPVSWGLFGESQSEPTAATSRLPLVRHLVSWLEGVLPLPFDGPPWGLLYWGAFRPLRPVAAASSMKFPKTYRVRAIKAPLKLIWTMRYIPPRRWHDRTPRRWRDRFVVRRIALAAVVMIMVALVAFLLIFR